MDTETWWHGSEIVAAGFAAALDPPPAAAQPELTKPQALARGQFRVHAMLDALKSQPEPLERLAALLPPSAAVDDGAHVMAQAVERAMIAERARIQAVRCQCIPGHEALIEQLAFDGKTTGPEAAAAVLAAEQRLRMVHQAAIASAPPAVAAILPPPLDPVPPPATNWDGVVRRMARRPADARAS